jgi:hypothetical protein
VEEEVLRLRPRAKRSVQLVAEVNWRNSERRSGCAKATCGNRHDMAMATGSRWV